MYQLIQIIYQIVYSSGKESSDKLNILCEQINLFIGTRKQMLDNFIHYQYQPYHKIYTHQSSQNSIFLGDVSAAMDMQFIQQQGIHLVITAAQGMEQVQYPNGEAKHEIYPLLDSKSENIQLFFQDFFTLIEQQIIFGSILVHCAAGVSRSATLLIAYFMKKFNWTFKKAIKFVRDKRPIVLPNLGFQKQLKEFQSTLDCKNKKESRMPQSSQFTKRLASIKSSEFERKLLFSPTKREYLPGIRYSTTLVRSKQLQKIECSAENDYILEIPQHETNYKLKKTSKNNKKVALSHHNNKETQKKSSRKVKNSKEVLISKIQSGRSKLLQWPKNFDRLPSPSKYDRKDTFYEQQIKGKKLSALSNRNQLRRQEQKILRNYSNNTRRIYNFAPIYEEANHVVVQKLQKNERRFVTEKQLRNIGIQRLFHD